MSDTNLIRPVPFEDHFLLSAEDLARTLAVALASGGDFAEVFLEYRAYNFVMMEEDIIKETAESVSLGMGIRVLSGEKTGYGYTNDLSPDKIRRAALAASAIACAAKTVQAISLRNLPLNHNYYRVVEAAHRIPLEPKIAFVKEA